MSYGVRYRCTHKANVNSNETTFRIDILENGYSGAITELLGSGEVFSLQYENINSTEPLSTSIQRARLDFFITVRNSSEQSILTDIFEANEGSYQMALYEDGDLVWIGYVINDLLELSEADYPYTGKISAKDFTRLSQYEFTLSQSRNKIITTIANILGNLSLGLGIKTYTNWTHENISGDFLNAIYLDERQLRDFGEIGVGAEFDEDDRAILSDEALYLILRSFGLILRQANGYYHIYQLSGLTDSTTTEYTYNSSGVQTSSQTVDLGISVDRDQRFILPSSQTNFNPGLKRTRATLVHNTAQAEIKFDSTIVFEGSDSLTKQQFFNSNGNQKLRFKSNIIVVPVQDDDTTRTVEVNLLIYIQGNTSYFLRSDGKWVSGTQFYNIPITSTRLVGSPDDPTGPTRVYEKAVEIESEEIPIDADGTLYVVLNSASYNNGVAADDTEYQNSTFEIIGGTDAENSVNILYQATSDTNFSKTYDHGAIAFGDGPAPYSPSALRYGTGDGDITSGGWSFVGLSQDINVHRLLLQEILYMQSRATKNLNAELYGSFEAHKTLVYDSTRYFFLGGSLNGYNTWNADFLELSFNTGSLSFSEIADARKTGGFTGASSGTVENFWENIKQSAFFNTVFLQNYVGELSAELTRGTQTSLTANLSAQLRAGEDFIVVDKENEKPYFINVTANVNTGENRTVAFDEQYFPVTLPVGSPIILSGGLLQSYFTIDPTKLKIQVDNVAGDFASLELRVDATESSITQSVQFDTSTGFTRLVAGPEGSAFIVQADQIQISGSTTFSSGYDPSTKETPSGAQAKADTAQSNAITTSRNNIATNLGYTDYADMVAEATAGNTVIDGGFIRTSLIQVENLLAQNIGVTGQLTIGSTGYIQSTGYSATNGFRINADGTANFQDVTIGGESIIGGGAELDQLTITGRLTLDTGDLYAQGSSGNYVILDNDGIRGVSNTLGTVFDLPSDGSAPTFSSGIINETIFEISTNAVLRTSSTALDGSASSAGVLINNTGVFAGQANQNTSTANVRIKTDGTIYLGNTAGSDYVKYESGTLTVRGTLNASDISAGTISSITVATGTATISGSTPSGTGTYLDSGGRMFSGSSGSGLFVDTPNGDIYIYDYTFNDTLGANTLYHRKDLGAGTSPNRAGFIHGIKYTDSGTPKWTGIAIGTGGSGDVYFAPHADDGTEFSYEFSKELIWSKANQRWEFDDDLYVGGTFTNPSDQRYKENIVPLGNVLDDLLSLSTVVYDMKDFMPDDERRMIGVYAQEIEQYFPEAVVTGSIMGDDGVTREIKSVSYTQLVPVLIKAIKELNDKIG